MQLNHFRIKYLSALSLAVFLSSVFTFHPVSAQNIEGKKGHDLKALMADLRVEAINPVEIPAFTLRDHLGKKTDIKDYAGKVMLINFWTTY